MSLSVTIVWPTFADGVPLTLPALRRPATISLAGSVGIAEVVGNWPASRMVPDAYWYAAGVFATDTYAVTLSPALTALANGVEVAFKAEAVCVAASLLNVNSLGAKPLFTSFNVAVLAGDIRANQVVQVRYNTSLGASGGWQILSQSGNPAHRYITSAGSANAYTATYAPSCASLAAIAGVPLRFKANFTNTGVSGFPTFSPDGLTAKPIKHRGNIALGGGEIVTNGVYEVVYDVTLDVYLLTSAKANLAPAVVAASRNLVGAWATNSTATIAADSVVLVDPLNNHQLATAVSLTLNMAGGVALLAHETGGAEAASRWYYVWLIGDGTNVSAVLEDAGADPTDADPTATPGALPTGPDLSGGAFAGYTYKALVGVLRNDGSSNLVNFYQQDRMVWVELTNLYTAKAPGGANTYQIYCKGAGGADVDMRTVVPPHAKTVHAVLGVVTSSVGNVALAAYGSGATGLAVQHFSGTVDVGVPASLDGFGGGCNARVPLKTRQTVYWKCFDTAARIRVSLVGFEL